MRPGKWASSDNSPAAGPPCAGRSSIPETRRAPSSMTHRRIPRSPTSEKHWAYSAGPGHPAPDCRMFPPMVGRSPEGPAHPSFPYPAAAADSCPRFSGVGDISARSAQYTRCRPQWPAVPPAEGFSRFSSRFLASYGVASLAFLSFYHIFVQCASTIFRLATQCRLSIYFAAHVPSNLPNLTLGLTSPADNAIIKC